MKLISGDTLNLCDSGRCKIRIPYLEEWPLSNEVEALLELHFGKIKYTSMLIPEIIIVDQPAPLGYFYATHQTTKPVVLPANSIRYGHQPTT